MRSAIRKATTLILVIAMLVLTTGSAAAIVAAPSGVDLGNVALKTTATKTITIGVNDRYRISSHRLGGDFGWLPG